MAQRQSKNQNDEVPEWIKGQKCEVYDHAKKRWVKGEVIDVFKDNDGEWVNIKFGRNTKQLQPDSSEIRGLQRKRLDSVHGWKVGNRCEWYNRARQQWVDGDIINIFSNELGDWLRVRCGQRIHDVLGDDVEHDLKPRGSTIMKMSVDDLQTIKHIATKHRVISPTLHRIFGKSKQFLSDEATKSYVLCSKCLLSPHYFCFSNSFEHSVFSEFVLIRNLAQYRKIWNRKITQCKEAVIK